MKTRTSWREKLEKEHEAKIVDIPPKMVKTCGTGKMLIPRPLDVDALIRRVEKGKIVTQSQIREKLAKDSGADVACPMTTCIFICIAAEAAEEDLRMGKSQVTPYWRVVKDGGSLNERFPGGVRYIERLLARFMSAFVAAFVVSAIVIYAWNLVRHGEGAFNWETTFFFAVTLGVVLTILGVLRSRGQ